MTKKLTGKGLMDRYPKLFRQKDLDMTQTCMIWGVDTGPGWLDLLDLLCSQLQWDIDKNNYPQIEATQVKEKFGGLRFYYSGAEGEYERLVESGLISKDLWEKRCGSQEGMIHFAERCSEHICESCGTTVGVFQTSGWIRTTCPACEKDREKFRNATE